MFDMYASYKDLGTRFVESDHLRYTLQRPIGEACRSPIQFLQQLQHHHWGGPVGPRRCNAAFACATRTECVTVILNLFFKAVVK